MNPRILLAASAALLLPAGAIAADELTSLHPEAAYPNNAAPLGMPGRYAELNQRVQQKLHELGFDAGPVNGDFDSKTQAALAQFQLSRNLIVNGMLDSATLAELGIAPEAQASAGATSE